MVSRLHSPAQLRAAGDVLMERNAQDERWGEQNHPDGTGLAAFQGAADRARFIAEQSRTLRRLTWAHILTEEFAEAMEAGDTRDLRAELVQLSAVAQAWIEAIDRRATTTDFPGARPGMTTEGDTTPMCCSSEHGNHYHAPGAPTYPADGTRYCRCLGVGKGHLIAELSPDDWGACCGTATGDDHLCDRCRVNQCNAEVRLVDPRNPGQSEEQLKEALMSEEAATALSETLSPSASDEEATAYFNRIDPSGRLAEAAIAARDKLTAMLEGNKHLRGQVEITEVDAKSPLGKALTDALAQRGTHPSGRTRGVAAEADIEYRDAMITVEADRWAVEHRAGSHNFPLAVFYLADREVAAFAYPQFVAVTWRELDKHDPEGQRMAALAEASKGWTAAQDLPDVTDPEVAQAAAEVADEEAAERKGWATVDPALNATPRWPGDTSAVAEQLSKMQPGR